MKQIFFVIACLNLILTNVYANEKDNIIYCLLDKEIFTEKKLNKESYKWERKKTNKITNYEVWEFYIDKKREFIRIISSPGRLVPARTYNLLEKYYEYDGSYQNLTFKIPEKPTVTDTLFDSLNINRIKGTAYYKITYKDYIIEYNFIDCSFKKPKSKF